MNQKEFESEMGKARGMGHVDTYRRNFWAGYPRGLRRGYHGKKFGTDEDHRKWWGLAEDDDDLSRQERGYGDRAGFRCASLGAGILFSE